MFNVRGGVVLMGFVLGYSAAGTLRASSLTSSEKNIVAMSEAAFLSTAMIIQEFGAFPEALPLTGTFSDSGWSLAMNGSVSGMPVALSFTGTFNSTLDQGSFTSSGTLGTATWSSPGSWSFMDIDANTVGLLWDATATIAFPIGPILLPDVHIIDPKIEVTMDDGTTRSTTSQGKYVITIAGIPIKTVDQRDDSIGPSNRGRGTVVVVASNQDIVSGTVNFDNNTFAGAVVAVPEPNTLLLIGLGIFGVLGMAMARSNRC